ncbi:MAG: LysM peptidoglycan-binding domain-containing protein [Verrucomicrobiales bacterium]
MNNETPFTTEFFDKESKRRKQIPIAVFTIVAAHVVLFAGLLGAAGCKKETSVTAEDKGNAAKTFAAAEYQSQPATPETTAGSAAPATTETPQYGPLDKVMITEPDEPVHLPLMNSVANAPAPSRTSPRPAAKAPVAAPAPAANASASSTYVVKSGDSLSKIAKIHRTTTKEIKKANGLKSDVIRVGQKLKITGAKNREA